MKGGEPSLQKLMEWYHHIGVSETIAEESHSKLNMTLKTLKPTHQHNPQASATIQRAQMSSTKKVQPMSTLFERPEQTSQSLRDQLAKVQTLDELKQILLTFEGCALKKTAKNTVFADGNPNADVMLVGEAPGADEDREGLPFVGRSGKLLDLMFQSIGLTRKENLYISNIIPWRPPGNRQPTAAETTICLPFIQRHIELVAPKYLIFVGGVSAKALLNTTEGIMRLRGKWIDYTSPGLPEPIKAMPIYHPAYILRSPGQKSKVWHDLLTLHIDRMEHGSDS